MNEIEVKVTANKSRKFYQMYYVDPTTRLHVTRSTKETKYKAALVAAAKWQQEICSGRDNPDGRRMTWDQFRDVFWERRIGDDTPDNTAGQFRTAMNHLERLANPAMLSSVTTPAVADF